MTWNINRTAIVLGFRYYSVLLTIPLGVFFYLYADLAIVKLVIIGMGISFVLLITKGVALDLEDLSKRIRSLEERCKALKDGDSIEGVTEDNQ